VALGKMTLVSHLMVVVLLFCGCASTLQQPTEGSDPRVQQLLKRQDSSPTGVIRLTPAQFDEFLTGKKRPYHFVFSLTADHLLDRPQLQLRELRKNFGYLAKTARRKFANTPTAGKVFFGEMEFTEAQDVFRRLGVDKMPYIFRISTTTNVPAGGNIKLKRDDVLQIEQLGHYPITTDDLSDFVKEKTGVDVGKVEKPSPMQNPLFPLFAISILGFGAWVGYKLYYAPFMQHKVLYVLGALLVFWFSVSGGMFNIIRNMPMVTVDPNTKQPVYFMHQGQLGMEGFAMGSLYTGFGLCFAVIVYLGPCLKNPTQQRYLCYTAMAVALWCIGKLVGIYRWKTGYHWRTYF
jgi:oligosaccharyltransferase complex subunit gamma